MSQIIHLASAADLDRLEPMVAAFHALSGVETGEEHRRAALAPLLEGSPHGAIWLIGPRMAPVGYIAVSFGWSLAKGGLDGRIEEFWVREKVRRRGMGGEALAALQKALRGAGVFGLGLEVPEADGDVARICARAGFAPHPGGLMTWTA